MQRSSNLQCASNNLKCYFDLKLSKGQAFYNDSLVKLKLEIMLTVVLQTIMPDWAPTIIL